VNETWMKGLRPRGKLPPIPGLRRLWRVFLRVRYLLLHRHRYDGLVLEKVGGRGLIVLPGVFNPALLQTGEFMARELGGARIQTGATVLDLGCGSGLGSVTVAPRAGSIVATDVTPAALRNVRLNAVLHDFEEKLEVIESDLFDRLAGRRFDAIVFNPPFYLGAPRSDLDRAWRGQGIFERFAEELPRHLTPGGSAWVVFSTAGELDALLAALLERGLAVELAAEQDVGNEILVLYRVRAGKVATA